MEALNVPNKQLYRQSIHRGFSYVEVLLTSVIISILLVSAVRLFGNIGRSRASAFGRDIAAHLAIEMIEEIRQQSYQDPQSPGAFGREAGETALMRSTFDDIDDYDGWSSSPPIDRTGQPYSNYDYLTRSVAVRYVQADDFTQETEDEDEGFKEVTITVSHAENILAQQIYVIADTDE